MALQLYNTLTRKKEVFKPLHQDEVKVYYCGPTPYNYVHIGNLRSYLFEDFIVRSLRFLGYRVRTVMNITDIDDKTIRKSTELGISREELTQKYTEAFLLDLAKLQIIPADTIVPISGIVDEMIRMIQILLDKDYAYLADDGSIYYSIDKFKDYGHLAHLDRAGMISSVRINNDEYEKEQVADFALWKAYDEKDGPNKWEAKFMIKKNDSIGDREKQSIEKFIVPGRPGWHIECSACNAKYFGSEIDIHMGGVDLVFPHHQNEIAQSEAAHSKTFSKYWMHGGHLLVDNKKMAKSANNFYTLSDITARMKYVPEKIVYRAFRLMALQNTYRDNFNFTFDRLTGSINTINGLDEMMKRLGRYMGQERPTRFKIDREFRDKLQSLMQEFIGFLEDDFAFPEAITLIFELQGMINSAIDAGKYSPEEKLALIDFLKNWDSVLAIFDFSLLESATDTVPEEVQELLESRQKAKKAKNYELADTIRRELESLGYTVIDEKENARVEKL